MTSIPQVADDGSLEARLARSDGLHPPRPLSRAERERFLSEAHVVVLSVDAGPGRPPASVPLWYAYQPGGDVVVNTSVSSRKAGLVRAAGAVTLTVQHATPPYRYVVVEGQVVEVVHPSPLNVRRAIARRYLSAEGADAAVDRYDPDDQVLFFIRPRRWHSADFSGRPSGPTHDSGVRHGQ
ncbi:pyridoxamine 5'-phosphate oxidase family protein [Qaidamihabitans albus]|uniref:pyridoxamine 5'-phosphate oxidase family protein n=1 Tax=Qaidamihabitans albus TaxID=2795733 RepID=UPI0018F173F6|nr:pyridoxamine 5'-phosphate oxidase family protein [Qaidamihabitans albus]